MQQLLIYTKYIQYRLCNCRRRS